MIPLSDTLRPRSFPVMNWILIGINTLVFMFEINLSPVGLDRFLRAYALIPANLNLTRPELLVSDPLPLVTLVSSMFLHGGWFHFLSNIWVLHIFGDNVEDRMGPGRYLLFFLLSGIVASFMQTVIYPESRIPTIGASGAIAGVMSAYFLFFPRARILTLIPVFIIPWLIEIPALIYLGFWFVSQLYSGFFSLGLPAGSSLGGVAWWAHIGGFLFGLAFARAFIRPSKPVRVQSPEDYPHW